MIYKDFYQNGLIGGETLAYAPNEIIAELLKEDSISSIDMQKILQHELENPAKYILYLSWFYFF